MKKLIGCFNRSSLIFFLLLLSCITYLVESPTNLESIKNYEINQDLLINDLKKLTENEHPFGSDSQKNLSRWVQTRAETLGLKVKVNEFISQTPNPARFIRRDPNLPLILTKKGFNLIAKLPGDLDCNILLASHYDTKKLVHGPYVGANDSASSSGALFHIAEMILKLTEKNKRCSATFIWFDGEESVLPNWNDGFLHYPIKIQDNTYGSRHLASILEKCGENHCLPGTTKPIVALILLDMIGSPDIKISRDSNSDPTLIELMLEAASDLNLSSKISQNYQEIEDDHIPFKKIGVPVLNIIDFNNLTYWHQPNDTLENLSVSEIMNVCKITFYIFHELSLSN